LNVIYDCFKPSQHADKYLVNLFEVAKYQLFSLGIEQIYSEEICCYSHEDLFYSYRRDKQTGRFASFLWKSDYSS
jgi:copper oxidase (laccase) domain-containing protein